MDELPPWVHVTTFGVGNRLLVSAAIDEGVLMEHARRDCACVGGEPCSVATEPAPDAKRPSGAGDGPDGL